MRFRDPPGTGRWTYPVGAQPEIPGEPVLSRAVQCVLDDVGAVTPPLSAELRVGLAYAPARGWSAVVDVDGAVSEEGIDPGPGRLRAAAVLADAVSTHLSGYEFAQWPVVDGRMLVAEVHDGRCVWVDVGTRARIAPIGGLRAIVGAAVRPNRHGRGPASGVLQ